jgi:hypothetical protein
MGWLNITDGCLDRRLLLSIQGSLGFANDSAQRRVFFWEE